MKKGCANCDCEEPCGAKKKKMNKVYATKALIHGGDIYEQEKVNHPEHYNTGKIEVIDAIEDWSLGFNDGNAIKHIARHRHKGNPIQDIEKAIWYLQRHIDILKKEKSK